MKEIMKILRYLASDRLGYQYTENIARAAGVAPKTTRALLEKLEERACVDVVHTDPDPAWQITKYGMDEISKLGVE